MYEEIARDDPDEDDGVVRREQEMKPQTDTALKNVPQRNSL